MGSVVGRRGLFKLAKAPWFSSFNARASLFRSPPDALEENQKGEDNATLLERVREENAALLERAKLENAALLERAREFEDKYLRALAETENVRSRLTKQIQDAKLFAVQGFCKDMTEIEEILRMAIESVPKDQITAENKHLKTLYEGLTMTSSRLLQVFKAHGLTTINPINKKFNPNEHEAVVVQEVEGKEAGTVIFVSKHGYKLHDRVIRPAIVGVSK